jgi:hypothetical protein
MVLAHKEYRFVFLAIPLLLVLLAYTTTLLASRFPAPSQRTASLGLAALGVSLASLLLIAWLGPQAHVSVSHYGLALLGGLLLVTLLCATPLVRQGLGKLHPKAVATGLRTVVIGAVCLTSLFKGHAAGILRTDDRLLATLDLSRRVDLVAVLDVSGSYWGKSGGFYYLHKNVPYYFPGNLAGLSLRDSRLWASHMLMLDGDPVPPGFRISASFGTVVVLEQISPPQSYRKLKDGREPQTKEVEDLLPLTVRPRF